MVAVDILLLMSILFNSSEGTFTRLGLLHRMIVSRLFYTFTRTEASLVKITNPLEKPTTATDTFYGKVERNLFSLSFNKHQNYNLYMGKETLYSRRYTFDLYFETELARLDFVRVEVQLSKYLQQHLSKNVYRHILAFPINSVIVSCEWLGNLVVKALASHANDPASSI